MAELVRFILVVAWGAAWLGPSGCGGPGEEEGRLAPDASARIHILKTGGSQGAGTIVDRLQE